MQYWGASHDSTSHDLSHHTGSRGNVFVAHSLAAEPVSSLHIETVVL